MLRGARRPPAQRHEQCQRTRQQVGRDPCDRDPDDVRGIDEPHGGEPGEVEGDRGVPEDVERAIPSLALQQRLPVHIGDRARQEGERDDRGVPHRLRLPVEEEVQEKALQRDEDDGLQHGRGEEVAADGRLVSLVLRDEVRRREGEPERPDVLQDGRKEHQEREIAAVGGAERPRDDDARYEQHELPDETGGERADDRPACRNAQSGA